MRAFGQIIRELRIARRMTLLEVAEGVGISVADLSAIEWERRGPPDSARIDAIASVLGVSSRELHESAAADH